MQIYDPSAHSRAGPPLSSTLSNELRLPAILLASLAMACADSSTAPRPISGRAALNARTTSEVLSMLGDAKGRVTDALDDAAARAELATSLDQMIADIESGHIDAASTNADRVRVALTRAAAADMQGAGDADRGAIELALEAVDEIIAIARHPAAAGI